MIIVTGCAGFIGFHVAKRLLDAQYNVVGIDNLNSYYDINLKLARLNILKGYSNFNFHCIDLANFAELNKVFKRYEIDYVIHLAAQAGVRYSLEDPFSYISSNLNGFFNLLELSRLVKVKHFVFASTSSVYGANTKLPFSESDATEHPVSLYSATKKSNEMLAHSYAAMYGVPCSGLRFFTVYGPWGRPDMALFIFTKNILAGKPIEVFNNGHMQRDFTYIDDIVTGIIKIFKLQAQANTQWNSKSPDPGSSCHPYAIYNIGNSTQVELMEYVHAIEQQLGMKAQINFKPMQIGDIKETRSDIARLQHKTGYEPKTQIAEGIAKFIAWYKSFYKIKTVELTE